MVARALMLRKLCVGGKIMVGKKSVFVEPRSEQRQSTSRQIHGREKWGSWSSEAMERSVGGRLE